MALVRPAVARKPELRPASEMPKRRALNTKAGRVALLHSLAHIELNAINLAWDLIGRFTSDDLPQSFFSDWINVGQEEARHFALLSARLNHEGSSYGQLIAHDGLWEAADRTKHDLLARLAVVPMVLEARGLDVTPGIIQRLVRAGDHESATVLQTILHDEIGHVSIGEKWFRRICRARGRNQKKNGKNWCSNTFLARLNNLLTFMPVNWQE